MFDFLASAGAQWLWQKHGKALANKTLGKLKEQWSMFRWQEAEHSYRALLRKQHSTTHLLGNPREISVEGIFTDVYVLDKLTAVQRFSFENLRGIPLEHNALQISLKRRPALRLIVNEHRLLILGKPGAGKTTLLKYITLQACAGKLGRTPIFVSIKDWSDSHLELLPFLALQFKICAFPDSEAFIEQLLIRGNILLLFDGLDEVNSNERQKAIQEINKAAKLYREIQIIITCRIAATDYIFDQFTYLEIADFDEKQIRLFAGKWYQKEPAKLSRFIHELEKPESRRLMELARTPLLLALLCLAFDETSKFPSRRADLYKEAIDALLKRWDTTRGIQRAEVYHSLSLIQKRQMLAYIAKQNFEEGSYFIRADVLARQIERFLSQNLGLNDFAEDGETILKAIEAQHGILVERGHGIYSFSHLTFQEYFTAQFLASSRNVDALNTAITIHLMDTQWTEIFLLTASLLDSPDSFFYGMLKRAVTEGKLENQCKRLISWAANESRHCKNTGPATRFFLLFNLSFYSLRRLANSAPDLPGAKALNKNISLYLETSCAIALACAYYLAYHADIDLTTVKTNARKITSRLSQDLGIGDIDYPKWNPYISDAKQMDTYMSLSQLIVECLKLADFPNRTQVEAKLLTFDV